MNNRFEEFYKKLGLNQTQMADAMGIDQSSFSRQVKKFAKTGELLEYAIIIMELKFNLNRTWLISGKGAMFMNKEYTDTEMLRFAEDPQVKMIETYKSAIEEINRLAKEIERLSKT